MARRREEEETVSSVRLLSEAYLEKGEKGARMSDGTEGGAGMVDGVQESGDISRQNVHDVGV